MSAWPIRVKLGEVSRGARKFSFEADSKARGEIVARLDLASLTGFSGEATISPWLDGAKIEGRYQADLAQICGITAEPLPALLAGEFVVTVLPPGSENAPQESGELEIDLDADDPPDILENEVIDLTDYAVEHLALDLDPFPRKPGAEFVPPEDKGDLSPFAALKNFKPRNEEQ